MFNLLAIEAAGQGVGANGTIMRPKVARAHEMAFFSRQSWLKQCAGTGETKDRYFAQGRRAACNAHVAVPARGPTKLQRSPNAARKPSEFRPNPAEFRPNSGRSASAAALLGIAPPNRYHHALI